MFLPPILIGHKPDGTPVTCDLPRLPHLLIGGVAGSGKTMLLHALLTGVLQHTAPDDVQLLLIDCGAQDLCIYNGAPQLLTPVITSPKEGLDALHALAEELQRRLSSPQRDFPLLIVVIDEFAPLLQLHGDDFLDILRKLSMQGRQAGIHLLLSTLHTGSNVLSGLLRAYIPSRAALCVPTAEASRLLLDMTGAQRLKEPGDMLYYPAYAEQPIPLKVICTKEENIRALIDRSHS